jgi:hypothetical protein
MDAVDPALVDQAGVPSAEARDLHDRLAALPPLIPMARMSAEPNGV